MLSVLMICVTKSTFIYFCNSFLSCVLYITGCPETTGPKFGKWLRASKQAKSKHYLYDTILFDFLFLFL